MLVHELIRAEPDICDGVEGTFGTGPLARIPSTRSTSPSTYSMNFLLEK
jgi:hypothetical protein